MGQSDNKYQVFISSTYDDLREERNLVISSLWRTQYLPTAMEFFPATGTSQLEYINTILDSTDAYVLILAGMYGSLTDSGISYTEAEFNLAIKKKIPVLAFVYSDLSQLKVENLEKDPVKREKLDRFRERVLKGKLVSTWTNSNELALNVITSLSAAPLTGGWTRGAATASSAKYASVLEENSRLLRELEASATRVSTLEEQLKSAQLLDTGDDPASSKDSVLLTIEPRDKESSEWDQPQRQSYRMSIDDIMLYWGPELMSYSDQEEAFFDLASIVAEIINAPSQTDKYNLSLRSRNELKANLSARGLIELHSDYDNFNEQTIHGISLTQTGQAYIRQLISPNAPTDESETNDPQNDSDPWAEPAF
ncbi:MAG: DUF4062 domain-containing protein [Bifidobacterium sp.]|jgi:hypothetical protein